MRKVFALLMVAGLFTFASCGEKKAESTESTTTETMSEAPAADSSAMAAPADSSAMAAPADTAHMGGDTAAHKM